jgi:DNA-binding Lrp family transcriptional regulator
MNADTLDLIDKKLLYELDMNARLSLTQLAKRVRSSPAVVEYRLRRMEREGIIQNYLTFLDAGKLGLMIWNVYVEFQNTTEKEESEIISYLCAHPRTWWVARCSGRWNLIYSLCVKTVKEFYNIVNDVNSRFGKYLLSQSIAAHAEVEIISRGYFLKKPGQGATWYSSFEAPSLEAEDLKILSVMAKNARLSSTEIAKRTKLTPRIVTYRLKQLEARGIIHRFRLQLDVKKIGMSFYKAIIHVKEYTKSKNAALKQYCVMQGNIVHYEQKIGPWMLELELDAPSYEVADQQLKELKERFPDFVRSYELLLIKDEPKGDLDLTKML